MVRGYNQRGSVIVSNGNLLQELGALIIQLKSNLIAILPKLIFAIVIVLIGILFAHFFRSLVKRSIKNLDRLISNKNLQRLEHIRIGGSADLSGKVVYWIILFFFATAATQVLGLPVITIWLGGLMHYLPNILAAVIIVFLGIVGGTLLRDIIASASTTAGLLYGNVLGRIAQSTILLIAILIAVNQVGIDISIVSRVIEIVLAAILFSAALAFGLGARTSVSNILASYYLQSRYRQGQFIKIGDVEGEIIQITPTAVIIETTEGQVSVPAGIFSKSTSTMLNKQGTRA